MLTPLEPAVFEHYGKLMKRKRFKTVEGLLKYI